MEDWNAKIIRMLPSMILTRTMTYQKGISLAKIHREYLPGYASSQESGSRRLYKNNNGIQIKDSDLIEKIENDLPGTKRILCHPLWDILKKPDATLSEILQYMDKLDINLKKKLFKVAPVSKLSVRKKLKTFDQIYYVSKENSLDALACLLMLIRESEIKKEVQPYITSKWEAVYLIYRLSVIPPYIDIAHLIYHVVFNLFIEKNDPLPSGFTEHIWDDYPFDRKIPKRVIFGIIQDIYRGLLWNAEHRRIISNAPQEQLNFLFWVNHFFNKNEIKKALIKLPPDFDINQSSSSFPPPLSDLMERIRGDSRNYLTGFGTFLF